MTDRELLELAAKAAGIDFSISTGWGPGSEKGDPLGDQLPWNPLISGSCDALRLAVELRLAITFPFGEETVRIWYGDEDTEPVCEPLGNDPDAATCRAIVRAAAEIGKSMK